MKNILLVLVICFLFFGCSNNNDSSANVPEVVTIPAAPSNLNYTIKPYTGNFGGDATLNLTWTDNSNNETGFRIQHKPEGSTDWIGDGQDATNVNHYSKFITTFSYTNGHHYYAQDQYRIYATNSAGKSEYSNVITIELITFPNGPCTHCVP